MLPEGSGRWSHSGRLHCAAGCGSSPHDARISIPTWPLLFVLAIGLRVVISPGPLAVVKQDGGVVVRSWFSDQHFRRGGSAIIDIGIIYSMGVSVGVGFIPFVGSARMAEVVTTSGRIVWLRCLRGPRNRVLRLVRELEPLVRTPSAHSTSQS